MHVSSFVAIVGVNIACVVVPFFLGALQWCAVACAVAHESTTCTHIRSFLLLSASSPMVQEAAATGEANATAVAANYDRPEDIVFGVPSSPVWNQWGVLVVSISTLYGVVFCAVYLYGVRAFVSQSED